MQNARLLTVFLFVFFTYQLSAQWEWQNADFSNLDLGYELNSYITLDNEEKGDWLIQMIVQPDGKTLLLGYSTDTINFNRQHVLIRLNTDGNLDTSFGEKGMVKLPIDNQNTDTGYKDYQGIVIQSENKIVVIGGKGGVFQADGILLRYNSDGTRDTHFGNEGITRLETPRSSGNFKVSIQSDDKILMAGGTNEDLILARFEQNGLIDTTFGEGGKVIADIGVIDDPTKILLQENQKIIVIGRTNMYSGEKSEFCLARFLPNGDLDPEFGQGGKVKTSIGEGKEAYPADGVVQADGKIIVMGSAKGAYQPDYAMVRYLPNGRLDNTFGNRGKTITNVSPYGDRGRAMIVQPDGKIMVVGNSREWATHLTLIRYNANGKLDYDFGDRGKQRPYLSLHGSEVASIDLQDNKIVLAGNVRLESRPNNDFLLIRFLSDFSVGSINFQAQTNNALVYPNPIQTEAILGYTLETSETLTIQLTDLNGRILKTYLQNELQKAGDYQQAIDLPLDLPKGFYLIRISSESGQFVIKVVK